MCVCICWRLRDTRARHSYPQMLASLHHYIPTRMSVFSLMSRTVTPCFFFFFNFNNLMCVSFFRLVRVYSKVPPRKLYAKRLTTHVRINIAYTKMCINIVWDERTSERLCVCVSGLCRQILPMNVCDYVVVYQNIGEGYFALHIHVRFVFAVSVFFQFVFTFFKCPKEPKRVCERVRNMLSNY